MTSSPSRLVELIRKQARIARRLADERSAVSAVFPIGDGLARTRADPQRLVAPVVAVMGPTNAGKSSLINAAVGDSVLPVGVTPTTLVPVWLGPADEEEVLVRLEDGSLQQDYDAARALGAIAAKRNGIRYVAMETPRAARFPWRWLDLPGAGAAGAAVSPIAAEPWVHADVCIYSTPATNPLTATDVAELQRLAANFARDDLLVVISRCDALQKSELEKIVEYAIGVLDDAGLGRLPSFFVSVRDEDPERGLPRLVGEVTARVQALQRGALEGELKLWRQQLDELARLIRVQELSRVQPRTINGVRQRLHEELARRVLEVMRDLPVFAEQLATRCALPTTQRAASEALTSMLVTMVQSRLQNIENVLQDVLAAALSRELGKNASGKHLGETLHALRSLQVSPYFDSRAAIAGGAIGGTVGVALAALAVPVVGTALLAAAAAAGIGALVGGGIVGDGAQISSPDELRKLVAEPVTQAVRGALQRAGSVGDREIDDFCDLVLRAINLFAGGRRDRFDSEAVTARLKQAGKAAVSLETQLVGLQASEA